MIAHRRDYSRTLNTPGKLQPMSKDDLAFARRKEKPRLSWWARIIGDRK